MKAKEHQPTGHRDCCGDMIRRHDTVATVSGEGRILWVRDSWMIWYGGRHLEPLNAYGKSHIRVVQGCYKTPAETL